MTKGDVYTKEILTRILEEGCLDKNPRPKYADGTPAHTLSVNHGMCTYDITKNEDDVVEIWVKNYDDHEMHAYFFFPYDKGVIEI